MMMLIVDHFKILTDSPTTTKAPGPDYSFSSLTAEFPFRFVPIDEISVPVSTSQPVCAKGHELSSRLAL